MQSQFISLSAVSSPELLWISSQLPLWADLLMDWRTPPPPVRRNFAASTCCDPSIECPSSAPTLPVGLMLLQRKLSVWQNLTDDARSQIFRLTGSSRGRGCSVIRHVRADARHGTAVANVAATEPLATSMLDARSDGTASEQLLADFVSEPPQKRRRAYRTSSSRRRMRQLEMEKRQPDVSGKQ